MTLELIPQAVAQDAGPFTFPGIVSEGAVRFESEDESYMLLVDYSENKVVIGQQTPHTDMLLTMIDDDWQSENHAALLAFTQFAMGPIAGAERASTTNLHSLSTSGTKQSQWSMNRYITRGDIAWNRYDTAFWASSLLQQNGPNWSQIAFFAYDGTTEFNIATFSSNGSEINLDNLDIDFRFASVNEANFLFLNAGEDNIVLGATTGFFAGATNEAMLRIYHDQAGDYKYPLAVEVDNSNAILYIASHGASAAYGAGWLGRHARGSAASPLNTEASDRLGFMLWGGYGSGTFGNHTGFQAFANETYSATGRGTRLEFVGTSDGSTSRVIRMIMYEGLQVGPTPTGGDKGIGTINVSADVYKNNTAYTNPDFVLEHHYRGKIEEFKNNPGASEYSGLLDLVKVDEFMKENLHLPGISRGPLGVFDRGDVTLMLLEQIFLYLIEHQKQLQEINPLLN